jgi:hypothetical protein
MFDVHILIDPFVFSSIELTAFQTCCPVEIMGMIAATIVLYTLKDFL